MRGSWPVELEERMLTLRFVTNFIDLQCCEDVNGEAWSRNYMPTVNIIQRNLLTKSRKTLPRLLMPLWYKG
jgi:hypothetical protein